MACRGHLRGWTGQQLFIIFIGWVLIVLLFVVWLFPVILKKDVTGLLPQKVIRPTPATTALNLTDCPSSRQGLDLLQLKDGLIKLVNSAPPVEVNPNIYQPCHESITDGCSVPCSNPIATDPETRLKSMMCLPRLQLSDKDRQTIIQLANSIPEKDIIILSASSSNHYAEMQAMFHSLHENVLPYLPDIHVVLFDLGLTQDQRAMTEKHCKCQVVTFSTNDLPVHVKDPLTYSWKPLIMRATITKVKKLLVYQDASIRWTKGRAGELFLIAEKRGFLIERGRYSASLPVHTQKETFDFYDIEPCAVSQYSEPHANRQMYTPNAFIVTAILEPMCSCALVQKCMSPREPRTIIKCDGKDFHNCHRFDQSALGIVTAKLLGRDFDRFVTTDNGYYFTIKRGHRMNYFGQQEK